MRAAIRGSNLRRLRQSFHCVPNFSMLVSLWLSIRLYVLSGYSIQRKSTRWIFAKLSEEGEAKHGFLQWLQQSTLRCLNHQRNVGELFMDTPTIHFASVTLDCPNQEELADFYSALLGWSKQRYDEEWLAVISPDKHTCLLFQEVEDYISPVWPNEKGKQQQMTHIDFASAPSEKEAVVHHALACGATFASVQHSTDYVIFMDPVGHPFCISFFG